MRVLIWIFCLFVSLPLWAQEEYIRTFHSDLEVDASGLLTVKESIEIYAGGNQIQRGIVRSLPLSGTDYRHKKVKTAYKVISVSLDGQPFPYHTRRQQGNLDIYIGDQDKILEPGWYTFSITYSAEGQLGYFDDYDEVYWNVNGFGWEFRIEKISATIQLPTGGIFDGLTCYTGFYGSSEQHCQSEILSDGRANFTAGPLSRAQNLTVSAGFPKGLVEGPPPPGFGEKFGFFTVILLSLILLLGYYLITWKRYGMDPPKPVVVPEFHPPSGLSPAAVGMVHKGYFFPKMIGSTIVNLAVKGILQIEEKKTKGIFGWFATTYFELVKVKEPEGTLPLEERNVIQRLFPASATQVKIDGKYSATMATMFSNYRNTLVNRYQPMLSKGRNMSFWVAPLLLFFSVLLSALFFDFYGYPYNVDNKAPILFGLLVWSFILIILFSVMFRKRPKLLIGILLFLMVLYGYLAWLLYQDGDVTLNSMLLAQFIHFFMISFPIYAYLIKRPSEEKLSLRAQIDGFRMYLSAAEERQLQMFNPPEITPEVFEAFLPYAMALGVEKIWGRRFENMLKRSSIFQQNNHRPMWYRGVQGYAYHKLGSHLSKSLSRSISIASTQRSSGGGGSGSRGGGFSGGGRGGGGGRGW
jgi:uncharacterized membrane protein YgcG